MYKQKQIKHLRLFEKIKTQHMNQLNTYLIRILKTNRLVLGLLLLGIMTVNAQTFNETYLSNEEVAGQSVTATNNGFSIETSSLTTQNTVSFGNIVTSTNGQLTGTTDVRTIQRNSNTVGETIKTQDNQFLQAEINGTKVKLTKLIGLPAIGWSMEFKVPNVSSIYKVRVIQNEAQEIFLVGLARDNNSAGYGNGYFVLKTDSQGNRLWQNDAIFLGGSNIQIGDIPNLVTTADGGLLYSYRSSINTFTTNVTLARLNSNGSLAFDKSFNGGGLARVGIDALAEGPNQSTLIASYFQSNQGPASRLVTLESLSINGAQQWRTSINNQLPAASPSLVEVGAINFANNGVMKKLVHLKRLFL